MNSLNNNRGFSLVEMIIVTLIFVIVIGITGDAFNRIASKAISLSKTSESNIAGIVGLEVMRVDVESAGYGIPWSFQTPITYAEVADDLPGTAMNDNGRTFLDTAQNNIPRAVMKIDNPASADQTVQFTGADVLAIRSQAVGINSVSKRWTYIESEVLPSVNPSPVPHVWSGDNLVATDTVIMVQPVADMKPSNQLVASGNTAAGWSATYSNYTNIGAPRVYQDAEKKSDTYIIYGVSGTSGITLRMPFNRADYYVRRPATSEQAWFHLPKRCNPSTGVLMKGVVNHNGGDYTELPLLECILDMQVVFGLRTPDFPTIIQTDPVSSPNGNYNQDLTARAVREQVKEIQIYILTHDGAKDKNYTYPNSTIGVGPGDGITSGSGRTYNFAANGVTDWQNYRWKVYRVVARPANITGNLAQ